VPQEASGATGMGTRRGGNGRGTDRKMERRPTGRATDMRRADAEEHPGVASPSGGAVT